MLEWKFNIGDAVRIKYFDDIVPAKTYNYYRSQESKDLGEYFAISRDSINRMAAESDYYIISRHMELFSAPAYTLNFPDGSGLKRYYAFAEEMLEYIEQGDIEAETDIAPIDETDFLNYLFG